MSSEAPPRRVTIVVNDGERLLRLTVPEKWRRLVQSGGLTADTVVGVERPGEPAQSLRAAEVPELAAFFPDPPDRLSTSPELPSAGPPAPANSVAAPSTSAAPAPETDETAAASPRVAAPVRAAASTPLPAPSPPPAADESAGGAAPSGAAPTTTSGPPSRIEPRLWVGGAVVAVCAILLAMWLGGGDEPSAVVAPSAPATASMPDPVLTAADALVDVSDLGAGGVRHLSIAGLSLVLRREAAGDPLRLQLTDPDGRTASVELPAEPDGAAQRLRLGAGALDSARPGEAQVLLESSRTDGRCCATLRLLSRSSGAWSMREAAVATTGLESWPQPGPSGVRVWSTTEQGIADLFGPIAPALLPPRLHTLRDGVLTELDGEGEGREAVLAAARRAADACGPDALPACAAVVAGAHRLGVGQAGWNIVQARQDGRGYTLCQALEPSAACGGRRNLAFADMTDAIREGLILLGYTLTEPLTDAPAPEEAVEETAPASTPDTPASEPDDPPAEPRPPSAGGFGFAPPPQQQTRPRSVDRAAPPVINPSFDCGRPDLSAVERMICASPELAAKDREMAAAYAQAEVRMSGGALRRSQRAWLRLREQHAGQPDRLSALYAARIRWLRGEW